MTCTLVIAFNVQLHDLNIDLFFYERIAMHKKITFRSFDHSDAIEQYVLAKSEKLDKFFKREPLPIAIEIILESHREKHYVNVEIIVKSKNYNCIAHAQGSDMYAMIDQAVHIMIGEISRKKEKMGHDITSHHLNLSL